MSRPKEHRYKQRRYRKGQSSLLHRAIWEAAYGPIPEGMEVDHINCDPQDNRLENIRLVTSQQNKMNTRLRHDSSTGLKGLSWDSTRGRWIAHVTLNRKTTAKRFDCKLDAVAYLYRLRAELHGTYGRNA